MRNDKFILIRRLTWLPEVRVVVVEGGGQMSLLTIILNGPCREKTCLHGFANDKVADQPVHPRCLISAFVIH